MTGAFLRVKRNGKWESIEVEYLNRKERKIALSGRKPEELLRWIDILCGMLVACEETLFKED